MSEDYAWIVDLDATEEEAPGLAETVLGWLIDNGVIESSRSHCVWTDDGMGYPPGPRMGKWIQDIEGLESQIRSLDFNGLEVHTNRFTYFSLEEPDEGYQATCPRGHVREADEEWWNATNEWEAAGLASVACAECGKGHPIAEWVVTPDSAFALACLGFVFWNWVELSDSLVEGVREVLAPHRVASGTGAM